MTTRVPEIARRLGAVLLLMGSVGKIARSMGVSWVQGDVALILLALAVAVGLLLIVNAWLVRALYAQIAAAPPPADDGEGAPVARQPDE